MTNIRVSQSQIGGLMFRGEVTIKTADSYYLELSYLGQNSATGAEVFELHTEAATPNDATELVAQIEFDFFNFNFWVDLVEVILPDGQTISITVNQLI